MDEILRLSHISKTFPGVRALEDISFDLKRGEVHCLCGENGAGKSTVIKILLGAYQPDFHGLNYELAPSGIAAGIEAKIEQRISLLTSNTSGISAC